MILQIFFTKMAITQPKKVQIPKLCCLKSSTNIWPSFRNLYSIPKVIKIYLQGRKGSKPTKMNKFFTLQKIKIAFSKKFPKVWFDSFFLWLPTYETLHISLTKFLIQDRCDGRDARVAWLYWVQSFSILTNVDCRNISFLLTSMTKEWLILIYPRTHVNSIWYSSFSSGDQQIIV